MEHFTRYTGEICSMCGVPATHKITENEPQTTMYNLVAYVCCFHFKQIFGANVPCGDVNDIEQKELPKGYFGPTFSSYKW